MRPIMMPVGPPALRRILLLILAMGSIPFVGLSADGKSLIAGIAKVEITQPDHDAGDNPPFVRALVISDPASEVSAVLVAVDAVAIAEIGAIRDPYLENVRRSLKAELGIDPKSVVINASHCHALVCDDVEAKTIEAVRAAWENRVAVLVAAGTSHEDRISVNRRLKLKNGREADERHAYAMPPDEEIAAVGPIDPEIGLLRLDRIDTGKPLALVFHFSCHPIQGVPSGGNTADLSGFAAKTIEEQLGDGVVAMFLQGCGGDINPVLYKAVDRPRDARPLGTQLGLSALRGARDLKAEAGAALKVSNEILSVPRAKLDGRIAELEREITALTAQLKGTSLNFDTFLPLMVKYGLSGETPSADAKRYLQDEVLGSEDWKHLDEENRKNLDAYLRNIHVMEDLTRKQVNLALLEKHEARRIAAGSDSIEVEVAGLRVGDFRLVTFPGELTVPIGLGLKQRSPHDLTFISGYTNGYLYYAPTADQLLNRGGAQEDSDCLLAPEWQAIFEAKALEILKSL
ncbi:MAG: hypothetical protein KDN19_21555 [Verrucomicrobiae bacterium]|nr:hypothetical protein [Verrucomicrobiae bacterium]